MATVVTVAVNHPHKGSDHTVQKAAGPRDGWSPATRGSDPETKGPVDAGAHAMARKSADTANIEGNESAKYEAMEKKSLKGLKGGGTEKELREGHNERKWIAGATKNKGALHRQLGVPEGEKIPAKKMAAAASGKMGMKAEKRANLAKTLGKLRKK